MLGVTRFYGAEANLGVLVILQGFRFTSVVLQCLSGSALKYSGLHLGDYEVPDI